MAQRLSNTNDKIPVSYILSSKCPPDRIQDIKRVLHITPVYAAIVHDVYDYELAKQFSSDIIQTRNEDESIKLALYSFQDDGLASLVIGTADLLDVIYEQGAREAIDVSSSYKI